MIKAIGTAAREQLEQRFATKVYLELYVKVEPKWMETASGLQKAGIN